MEGGRGRRGSKGGREGGPMPRLLLLVRATVSGTGDLLAPCEVFKNTGIYTPYGIAFPPEE